MCVAGLNVTTQPCSHRWYELRRPCDPANNLANCPEKLRLEGWETRNDNCPWCDGNETSLPQSSYRLFGTASSASSTVSPPVSTELGLTRPRRSDSYGTISSLSRHSSTTSMESERGQRHREMNERLNLYLQLHPHEVLPSARKNYPTCPQMQSPSEDTTTYDTFSLRSVNGLGKRWKQSVRLSRAMFSQP